MAYTTIKKPSDYFNTKTYSGNSSTQAITSVNFQPDFTWLKRRDQTSFHYLFDSIRGVQKRLSSNSDTTEATVSTSLTSFDSDGFTLGSEGDVNESGGTYVGWNWLADNTSGSSNTDGSITSTVSANTTSGFSIVSYTGTGANATVGHGLGVAPAMIMIKCRSRIEEWVVYNQAMGNTHAIPLNLTEAKSTSSTFWQDTNPSSSVFYIGANNKHNQSGETFIAYCFAEKTGYSKFGSYTGNGNADGTFVYTGFKPAFTMIKRTDTTSDWNIMDNKRAVSFNPNTKELYANSNQAEATGGQTIRDFLSNGFKLRGTSGGTNASGGTYIYMAFAEEPLVGDNPATAR
jgi:hypothetical protein